MNSRTLPLLLSTALSATAQIPAFPGAQGFGAYATGGRGGDVYYVNSLSAASVPGSLRYGIDNAPTTGRTIVFAVSGYIPGGNRIVRNKVTIAGQTAPGDGIGFRGNTFRVTGNNTIIRNIRIRHGKNGGGGDCLNVDSSGTDSIIDHVTMQFSTDENISFFSSALDEFTMQNSVSAWGLESHNAGGLWDLDRGSCITSLWAHHHTRNPKARPYGMLEWINNVTYDWGIGFIMGDSETPAAWKANIRGCYFLSPPGRTDGTAMEKGLIDRNGYPNFSLYLDNCLHDSDGDALIDGTNKGYGIVAGAEYNPAEGAGPGAQRWLKPATPHVGATGAATVTLDDPVTAFKKVVSQAGAVRLDATYAGPLRDEVDTVLFNNVVTQRTQRISTEAALAAAPFNVSDAGFGTLNSTAAPADTDLDGMPDHWEQALGFNPALANNNTVFASTGGTFFPSGTPVGYTHLEEYLHFLMIPHTVMPKSTTAQPSEFNVDLRKFTAGFSASPVFVVSGVTGGGVTQTGAGGCLVRFVPTTTAAGVFGRAGFNFTVTDGAGSTWTQQFGILVTSNSIPRDLTWAGDGTTNVWNETNPLWRVNGNPTPFAGGDNVLFNDTGSNVPNISLAGALGPSGVVVNAVKDFTFAGTGALTGAAAIIKQGPGKLHVTNPGNTFAGGVQLRDGEVVVAGGASVGTGVIDFQDTAVTSTYAAGTTYNMANTLKVDAGATGTLNLSPRMTLNGATGAGTLNLMVSGATPEFERINGNWSNFTGTLNFIGTVPGALACTYYNGGNFTDFGKASLHLDNMNLGGRNGSGGNTMTIGSLTGNAGSRLGGAHYAGSMTYVVGGLNKSTTFPGSITDGTVGGSATHFTKTGGGTLTLTGPVTHSGTTTVSGGTLVVGGTLNGPLSVAAATISPGGVGVLTADSVAFTGSTLALDLSGSPTGGNDRIFTPGTGALGGTLSFKLNLLDRQLGAGVYELIKTTGALNAASGTALGLVPPLPADTRQTFALTRPSSGTANSSVKLTVTGTAADLVWTGSVDATWALNATTNWLNGPTADRFFNFDKVTFNDDSTVGGVTLVGSLQPREIVVANSATAYTLGGGSFDGIGTLTKTGSGTLTLTAANGYTGGTTLSGGTLSTTTIGGLGSGQVTLGGGTLVFGSAGFTLANPLKVIAASSLAVTGGNNTLGGNLSGAGTLALNTAGQLFTLNGACDHTGTLALAGKLRFNQGANPWGGAGTAFELVGASEISNRAVDDVTIDLGALTGGPGAVLRGSDQAGTSVSTYRIGARDLDTTFAGSIVDGTTQPVALVKTGGGQFTLSGASTHTGLTRVAQGVLRLGGSLTTAAAVEVLAAATLHLDGGSITAPQVDIEPGGTLRGCGTINADLNNLGTLLADCGGALIVTGDVVNNGTLRIASGTSLVAAGSFVNNGVLDLLTASGGLPPNLQNNGIVIDSGPLAVSSVAKSGNVITLTAACHSGHSYQLQRSASLAADGWTDVGPPQDGLTDVAGVPVVRTFTDPAASGPQSFYRIKVTP